MTFQMCARSEGNSAKVIDVSVPRHFDSIIALQDIAGQFEMPLISGSAIKFDQRQFNFRMSREERLLVSSGTKTCKQVVIDKANSGIEQRAIAGRPIIRNRALYHVADVVELVPPSLCFRCHALLCAI